MSSKILAQIYQTSVVMYKEGYYREYSTRVSFKSVYSLYAYYLSLVMNRIKDGPLQLKQLKNNTLKIRIWSQPSILYFIWYVSVILIVGLNL